MTEEIKVPLANVVIKEFDEMEKKRREEQYKDVLQSFKRNTKEGTGFALWYHSILYDDVRERLEKDGFKVKIVTYNSSGNPSYYITRNSDYVVEENNIGFKE